MGVPFLQRFYCRNIAVVPENGKKFRCYNFFVVNSDFNRWPLHIVLLQESGYSCCRPDQEKQIANGILVVAHRNRSTNARSVWKFVRTQPILGQVSEEFHSSKKTTLGRRSRNLLLNPFRNLQAHLFHVINILSRSGSLRPIYFLNLLYHCLHVIAIMNCRVQNLYYLITKKPIFPCGKPARANFLLYAIWALELHSAFFSYVS